MNGPKFETALSINSGWADDYKDYYWIEKNIPCQHACPAGTDIPGYLSAIARGQFDKAYFINLTHNVFPSILGRICTRPCEPPCRHGFPGLGQPVGICFLKRAASEYKSLSKKVLLKPYFTFTGKKVAVIGGGPAGLTLARQLTLYGHKVTIYEKYNRLGGMLVQGIPEFRLPKDIVEHEINQILDLGIEVVKGFHVGKDVALTELHRSYDALIIAAGTQNVNIPEINGVNFQGVIHGLDLLRLANEKKISKLDGKVIVIGGGFTAIDCARTAIRLGADDVKVLYRRTLDEMRVTPGEYEEMILEGVSVQFLANPKEIIGNKKKISSVRFSHTELLNKQKNNRRLFREVNDSDFNIHADCLILAIGQHADNSWIPEKISRSLSFNKNTSSHFSDFETSIEGLFVSGDFANGANNVIHAIGHAKKCARAVDKYLIGRSRIKDIVKIVSGRLARQNRNDDLIERQSMTTVPIINRDLEKEVELGFSKQISQIEAKRCYLCNYKYEIDMSVCIYCNQCCEVKPRTQCIIKAERLEKDEKERIIGWQDKISDYSPDNQFFYWINQEDCIRCNACLEVCPVNCISVQKVSLCENRMP